MFLSNKILDIFLHLITFENYQEEKYKRRGLIYSKELNKIFYFLL